VSRVGAHPGPGCGALARLDLTALGTSALLLVTDPAGMAAASGVLRTELAEIDRACSRFRPDSEISQLHRCLGRTVSVSPVLAEALDVALRAAKLTNGLVDPTVGHAVRALGYDRDFAQVRELARHAAADDAPPPTPAPGWWRLHWDRRQRTVLLPRGVALDLGATAKALAADRAATRAARAAGCGVLVSLGGDISVAGKPPNGGWRVAVADDHRRAMGHPDQIVTLTSGGLATSSTVARSWLLGGRPRHHIVDPRTGDNPLPVWRTVTVAAGSCVDANVASTAAIVLGTAAPNWLSELRLPARLVAPDGQIVHTAAWPTTEGGV
jgi:thiamine biosynthesis lipoprotein